MVDIPTAKQHGICPICEGYGGRDAMDDDPCERDDSTCAGSCPKCWCPGCHDGWSGGDFGSREAYDLVQRLVVDANQLEIPAPSPPDPRLA